MKYEQHNFVVTVSAKADSMTARMNEVFEVKLALARNFINNKHKFAIVSEDIVSNEQRIGASFNLIVSIMPKADGIIKTIDESHTLQNEMARVVGGLGYKYIIADEDMMSDFAKQKIQYLPKEDGEWMA